MVIDRHLMQ